MSYIQKLNSFSVSSQRLGTFLIILIFAAAPLSLHAQNEPAAEDEDNTAVSESVILPEVVVSASRVPVPAEHVGSSVTVFSAEEIKKRQPNFVHELLREVPSVAVSQTGANGGNAQVRIRGAEANHTLVLIDGLDMGNPFSSDEFEFQHLPVSSIESIEVLRGPQSSIHGSETIGGVIQITTPIPEEGTTSSASIELGSHTTRNARAYVGTSNEQFFTAASISLSETEGISARTHNTERDGFENRFLHLKSGVNLGENIDLSAVLIRIQSDSDYDSCSEYDSNGNFVSSSNDCGGKDRKTVFGTTLNFDRGDDHINHQLKFSKSRHVRNDFKDGTRTTTSIGETDKLVYQGTLNLQTTAADHSTTFAVERETSKVDSNSLSNTTGGTLKLQSYILEHRANLQDSLILSVSARRDDNRKNNFRSRNTYRATAAWIPNDQVRFHGSYGTGVKNPTTSEIFGWTNSWELNPNLIPETSKGWDVGVEKEINALGLTLDTTYFNNKITNLIDPYNCIERCLFGFGGNPDPDGTNLYKAINQTGVSTIKGWELSAKGHVGENYEVSGHVTISKAFDANGQELVRRPSKIASLNIYRQSQFWGYGGGLNLNIQHTGTQTDGYSGNYVDLGSFTVIDLSGSLQLTPQMQLTGKITNLFDDEYEEVQGYRVVERSLFFGLTYDF